jgi:hypothetical protein
MLGRLQIDDSSRFCVSKKEENQRNMAKVIVTFTETKIVNPE